MRVSEDEESLRQIRSLLSSNGEKFSEIKQIHESKQIIAVKARDKTIRDTTGLVRTCSVQT